MNRRGGGTRCKAAGLSMLTMALAVVLPMRAGADQFDAQIRSLQEQNSSTQSAIADLQTQASSYRDAMSRLQIQADQVEQNIRANKAAQLALQRQIADAQNRLAVQRSVLAAVIRTMYVDGQTSTLEELARSKNMSAFVDQQTYRSAVRQNVQELLRQMVDLQKRLTEQKAQVDQLLQDEHGQQVQLAATEAEQTRLLAYNQDQQAAYTQRLRANQARIAELRAEQARYIAQYEVGGSLSGDPHHGGYPAAWSNAPEDSLLDPWGMFNRECVSYTAFKVHQDYRAGRDKHDMPYWGGIGDAKDWPANARNASIPVDANPSSGSIAISTAGQWGYSMYVEQAGSLNGQPAIYVSQYNADFTGRYSEAWRYTTGLVFIHF